METPPTTSQEKPKAVDKRAAQTAGGPPRAVKELPIALIDVDPDNRRIDTTDERFQGLVDSVRLMNVLQRAHVYVDGERYRLIDGERRFRAAQAAGFTTLPCEVWPAGTTRSQILVAGIILNDQREAHTCIQIARGLREVKNVEGLSHEQVAERLALPLERVKTYFSLFGASDALIDFFASHDVPLKVAAEFVRYEKATNEARSRRLIAKYVANPLTCEQLRQLRKRASEAGEDNNETTADARPSRLTAAVERAFRKDATASRTELEAILGRFGFQLVAVAGRKEAAGS